MTAGTSKQAEVDAWDAGITAGDLLTPTQAARLLGLTRGAIYHRLNEGLFADGAIVRHPFRLTDAVRFRKDRLVP